MTARPKPLLPLLALALLTALCTTSRPARAADPTLTECLSANESAIKLLRVEHKLRQARDRTLVCGASSCPGEVRDACQKRLAQIDAAMSKIVFVAKDGTGHDVTAVRVSMDGETIADHLDGTALAVEPGYHWFTFQAAGQPLLELQFVIREGDKDRRERITFASPPASAAPQTPPEPPSEVTPNPPPPLEAAPAPSPAASRQRFVGIGLGAGGTIGLALGGIFGGIAAADWSSAKTFCASRPVSCTTSASSPGFNDEGSAKTAAAVSTVGFIAGGVLVAGGVVVYLTAPKKSSSDAAGSARRVEVVPAGGPGVAGMTIRGWF
jgi:hypothetical protein